MKRVLAVILSLLFLCGCTSTDSEMNRVLELRKNILSGGCSFHVAVTADYTQKIYTFGMKCDADSEGALTFSVTAPETISGITGNISSEGGKLTFDDQALLFEMIADGQITPVSAPWLLVRCLRSGYIKACGNSDNGLHIQIDDSYEENAMHLDIWTDENNLPVRAEIKWQGKRILSMDVENFTIL